MIHRYSLADYILSIGFPEDVASRLGLKDENGNLLTSIEIGGPGATGEGSFVGSIAASRPNNTWETEGDATGSWVHNKSLNKTGTIELQLTQISDQCIELYQLFAIYESIQENVKGLTLTINAATNAESGVSVAQGVDCYIQKPADMTLGNQAQTLSWVFTCGQIIYYQ